MKDQNILLRTDFEQQTASTEPPVGSNQSYLGETEAEQGTLWRLVRRYLPYSACLVLLGSIAGFATVVLQAPVFKARVMLEVNAINESYLKSSLDPLSGSFDPNAVNVQTQIKLLQVGPVTKQIYDQMLREPPPQMAPRGTFASIRTRLRGAAAAHAEVSQTVALRMAVSTFDARPVSGTRLIELSCESTNPELAARFLNNVADRFIQDGDRSRTESAERTGRWLSNQLLETDAKLRKAESDLQQFVVAAGNDFAAPDSMLAEAELKQLQADFVRAQAERLAKQARFEADARGDVNAIPEVADDVELHEIRRRISDIRDQREVLAATLTPKHYKMQRLDEAEQELLAAAKARTDSIVARIRSEYDSALHKQELLAAAYQEKGGSVIAKSAKVTEYNALKRDADSLKVDRDTLVQRINQSGSSTSLPVGLIRLVEPSVPPGQPFKPNPVTQIGLGAFGGLMASLLFAIGREKLDKSIRAPGAARSMLRVPELGVIPSANRLRSRARHRLLREARSSSGTLAEGADEIVDSGIWGDGAGVMAESFRNTVASLIREASNGSRKVIMITSPEPGDGKTTIASNLAIALAESGKKVVVIDADFRRPKLRTAFHLLADVDITRVLISDVSLDSCPMALLASPTLMPRLWVSPNSAPADRLSELIYSPRISEFIRRMRREFDFVLVDVPPVLQLADARVFSRYVDGAALVIRAGQTDRRLAAAACQCLVDDRVPVFGTILNQWDPIGSPASSYYYQEMSEEN
jgi:succinoglycan biosynthesis transport protein ExoP